MGTIVPRVVEVEAVLLAVVAVLVAVALAAIAVKEAGPQPVDFRIELEARKAIMLTPEEIRGFPLLAANVEVREEDI